MSTSGFDINDIIRQAAAAPREQPKKSKKHDGEEEDNADSTTKKGAKKHGREEKSIDDYLQAARTLQQHGGIVESDSESASDAELEQATGSERSKKHRTGGGDVQQDAIIKASTTTATTPTPLSTYSRAADVMKYLSPFCPGSSYCKHLLGHGAAACVASSASPNNASECRLFVLGSLGLSLPLFAALDKDSNSNSSTTGDDQWLMCLERDLVSEAFVRTLFKLYYGGEAWCDRHFPSPLLASPSANGETAATAAMSSAMKRQDEQKRLGVVVFDASQTEKAKEAALRESLSKQGAALFDSLFTTAAQQQGQAVPKCEESRKKDLDALLASSSDEES